MENSGDVLNKSADGERLKDKLRRGKIKANSSREYIVFNFAKKYDSFG